MQACRKLTRSSLFYLLRRDSKDIQDFHHDLDDDVRHSIAWLDLRIRLRPFEEILDPLKYIDQGLLRRIDVLNGLPIFDVKLTREETDKIQTWRRTPAPAKITVAGEKAYVITVRSRS